MNLSILDFTLRLGAALLMGAAVGLERQWRQRMAGTRTNALVAAGAAAFVICAFMVRDTSRSEAQIDSYVVSGVGFLGGGVIFKDAGSVRGLFRIGPISALGNPLHALILTAAILGTKVVLRPLSYRLYPAETSSDEQEVTYGFELICRPDDEAHMRALLLQAMSRSSLTLTGLRSAGRNPPFVAELFPPNCSRRTVAPHVSKGTLFTPRAMRPSLQFSVPAALESDTRFRQSRPSAAATARRLPDLSGSHHTAPA
jgi:putative Mg2+ transporter-C (MgtC) family protein